MINSPIANMINDNTDARDLEPSELVNIIVISCLLNTVNIETAPIGSVNILFTIDVRLAEFNSESLYSADIRLFLLFYCLLSLYRSRVSHFETRFLNPPCPMSFIPSGVLNSNNPVFGACRFTSPSNIILFVLFCSSYNTI